VIPLHMGALHPFEQVLTLVLAFGPFVVLGLVIAHRRRTEHREDQHEEQSEGQRER
jgi:hypothetical protein